MPTNTKNKNNKPTVKCSYCGYPLSKTLSRCSFCGKEFDPSIFDEPVEPVEPVQVSEKTMNQPEAPTEPEVQEEQTIVIESAKKEIIPDTSLPSQEEPATVIEDVKNEIDFDSSLPEQEENPVIEKEEIPHLACKRCGNDELQFVCEYVELEEKPHGGIIVFLQAVATILLCVAGVLLFIVVPSCTQKNLSFFSIPAGIVTIVFVGVALLFFVLAAITNTLQPYRHVTYLRAVCPKCGESFRIEKLDEQ